MLLFSPQCWKMCHFIVQQNKSWFPFYNLWGRLHALLCFGKLWFVLSLGHWKMGWGADLLMPLNHSPLDEMCLSGTLCWRTLVRARKQWRELGTNISQGRYQERGDEWIEYSYVLWQPTQVFISFHPEPGIEVWERKPYETSTMNCLGIINPKLGVQNIHHHQCTWMRRISSEMKDGTLMKSPLMAWAALSFEIKHSKEYRFQGMPCFLRWAHLTIFSFDI